MSTNLLETGVEQNVGEEAMSNQILLIQRYLGHDREFKDRVSQWKITSKSDSDCWVCDRHIYSVLFWNKGIGNLMNTEIANKTTVLKFIKAKNKQFLSTMKKGSQRALQIIKQESKQQSDLERPVIYSESTGWVGRELHTLSEYCFLID